MAPGAAAKSQSAVDVDGFQARFNTALESWRTEGCPNKIVNDKSGAEEHLLCGAPPARAQIVRPADAPGMVDFVADCSKGHQAVWKFRASEDEVKADAIRQQERHAAALKPGAAAPDNDVDPFVAKITITMNVKTQDVSIADVFVPNPGAAAMMCLIAQHHFLNQLGKTPESPAKGPGFFVPPKKTLLGPGGRKLS